MVTGVWLYDALNIVPHTGHCASWFFFFIFFIFLFIFFKTKMKVTIVVFISKCDCQIFKFPL